MAAIIKIVHSLDFAAVAQEIVNCDPTPPPHQYAHARTQAHSVILPFISFTWFSLLSNGRFFLNYIVFFCDPVIKFQGPSLSLLCPNNIVAGMIFNYWTL
jgi:hypothetical protein